MQFFIGILGKLVAWVGNRWQFCYRSNQNYRMNKTINQNLLIICKYHPATNYKGSRVSFRTSIENSKRKMKGYDHRFNNIEDMVSNWIEGETGLKPICQVQLPNKSEQGLIYEWNLDLINAIGTKG